MSSLLADLGLEGKRFHHKAHIKPWLLLQLRPRGINIVIERSDTNKIIFKCRLGITATHRFPCPFRIRANFLIKLKVWLLVVINENHNHRLQTLESHDSSQSQAALPLLLPAGSASLLPLYATYPSLPLLVPLLNSISSLQLPHPSGPPLHPQGSAATPTASAAAAITLTLTSSASAIQNNHIPSTTLPALPLSSQPQPLLLNQVPQLPKLSKIVGPANRIIDMVTLTIADAFDTKILGSEVLTHQEKCAVLEQVMHHAVSLYRRYLSPQFYRRLPLSPVEGLEREKQKVPPLLALLMASGDGPSANAVNREDDSTQAQWLALIPLLPLLNDTDPEYPQNLSVSIENLIHMPGASGNTQSLVLPPFTAIQNKFTLLPTQPLPQSGATINPLHMLKPSTGDLKGPVPKDRFDFTQF